MATARPERSSRTQSIDRALGRLSRIWVCGAEPLKQGSLPEQGPLAGKTHPVAPGQTLELKRSLQHRQLGFATIGQGDQVVGAAGAQPRGTGAAALLAGHQDLALFDLEAALAELEQGKAVEAAGRAAVETDLARLFWVLTFWGAVAFCFTLAVLPSMKSSLPSRISCTTALSDARAGSDPRAGPSSRIRIGRHDRLGKQRRRIRSRLRVRRGAFRSQSPKTHQRCIERLSARRTAPSGSSDPSAAPARPDQRAGRHRGRWRASASAASRCHPAAPPGG